MKIRTDLNAVYFNKKQVVDAILHEAKILDLQIGAVEDFAKQVAKQVETWAKKRSAITKKDLDLRIAKELKKYHSDLAYVFKNRGKII